MLVDENECICALLIKFLAQTSAYFLVMNSKRCTNIGPNEKITLIFFCSNLRKMSRRLTPLGCTNTRRNVRKIRLTSCEGRNVRRNVKKTRLLPNELRNIKMMIRRCLISYERMDIMRKVTKRRLTWYVVRLT